MKKFLSILILSFLFLINVNAEDRKSELDKLFYELKNAKNLSSAQAIEIKIAKIWDKHPSDDRRGFRLTELLYQGSVLINSGELNKAYKLYTQLHPSRFYNPKSFTFVKLILSGFRVSPASYNWGSELE